MDALITAAARALAAGDPLGALKRVALRDDPTALALRGIAMAQLGELDRAKGLLRRAARAFGSREPLAHARCIVAEAEIALAARELGSPSKTLDVAREVLEAHGDHVNAAHARHLAARRCLLTGRLDDAEHALDAVDAAALPPAQRAVHELLVAGIAIRRVRTGPADAALERAVSAARDAGIPALSAEVQSARDVLASPAARLHSNGEEQVLLLADVERVLASGALVVDACRNVVRAAGEHVPLASRPVLFAIAQALGDAWPGDVSREALIEQVFRIRRVDETHRARLRVEVGRLRFALKSVADVRATQDGYELVPNNAAEVVALMRPVNEEHADVLALLADGEAWSTSALALALGSSQRSVQRALGTLAEIGKVQALGRGRARRWITAPLPGITQTLLLPGPLPGY